MTSGRSSRPKQSIPCGVAAWLSRIIDFTQGPSHLLTDLERQWKSLCRLERAVQSMQGGRNSFLGLLRGGERGVIKALRASREQWRASLRLYVKQRSLDLIAAASQSAADREKELQRKAAKLNRAKVILSELRRLANRSDRYLAAATRLCIGEGLTDFVNEFSTANELEIPSEDKAECASTVLQNAEMTLQRLVNTLDMLKREDGAIGLTGDFSSIAIPYRGQELKYWSVSLHKHKDLQDACLQAREDISAQIKDFGTMSLQIAREEQAVWKLIRLERLPFWKAALDELPEEWKRAAQISEEATPTDMRVGVPSSIHSRDIVEA